MPISRTGFTFFTSYYDSMKHLTLESRGSLVTMMAELFFCGKEPKTEDFICKDEIQQALLESVWAGIMPSIRASMNKSHKGKAGAPTGNANASKGLGFDVGKQSKNNHRPSLNIIDKSMINSNIEKNIFPLVSDVEAMWNSVQDNNIGKKEAQALQNEISAFRDSLSDDDKHNDDFYLSFLVYWATPLATGKWQGHCRYIEVLQEKHEFNVNYRLKTWRSSYSLN